MGGLYDMPLSSKTYRKLHKKKKGPGYTEYSLCSEDRQTVDCRNKCNITTEYQLNQLFSKNDIVSVFAYSEVTGQNQCVSVKRDHQMNS